MSLIMTNDGYIVFFEKRNYIHCANTFSSQYLSMNFTNPSEDVIIYSVL